MKTLNEKLHTKGAVFIAGESKNAGKTTFLNYVLKQVREKSSPAFLTIGIDGETKDQIYGTPKPRIYTQPGDFIVTTCQALEASFAEFEILDTFPFKTAMGRVVLAKTLRGGYLELIGAENNEQLSVIINKLHQMKIEQIFIDGAVNRITQVSSFKNSSFWYVTKVNPANLTSNVDRFKALNFLLNLPKTEQEVIVSEETYYFKGAVTSSKLTEIPTDIEGVDIKNVIFEDLTKVFLKHSELVALSKKYRPYLKTRYDLLGYIVNLYDVERKDFEELLGSKEILKLVYYNPYEVKNSDLPDSKEQNFTKKTKI